MFVNKNTELSENCQEIYLKVVRYFIYCYIAFEESRAPYLYQEGQLFEQEHKYHNHNSDSA